MTKTLCSAAIVVLALCSCSTLPGPGLPQNGDVGGQKGMLGLYLGGRTVDEAEPSDDQGLIGIEYAQRGSETIGWEVGLMGSAAEEDAGGADFEVVLTELYGGVRKEFGAGSVHPYVGGGISFLTVDIELSGVGSDDDSSVAGYAHGGVALDVSSSVVLGLDVRILAGSDIFGSDADYNQVALFLGVNL